MPSLRGRPHFSRKYTFDSGLLIKSDKINIDSFRRSKCYKYWYLDSCSPSIPVVFQVLLKRFSWEGIHSWKSVFRHLRSSWPIRMIQYLTIFQRIYSWDPSKYNERVWSRTLTFSPINIFALNENSWSFKFNQNSNCNRMHSKHHTQPLVIHRSYYKMNIQEYSNLRYFEACSWTWCITYCAPLFLANNHKLNKRF